MAYQNSREINRADEGEIRIKANEETRHSRLKQEDRERLKSTIVGWVNYSK